MIVKQIPIKTYVIGRGLCYQQGGNLFFNTLKSIIGRNFKDIFLNVVKPKAISLGKQGLDFGKELWKDNQKEIKNALVKEVQKVTKKLGEKPIKQIFNQSKESLLDSGKELVNKNKKKVSDDVQIMLNNLINGSGLKISR